MTTRLATLVVAAALALTGCTQESVTHEDDYQQALSYAKCIRDNGVPDFADPVQGDDGISQHVQKGQAEAFEKAKEACRDKEPQEAADDSDPVDATKLAAWTRCMREQLPKFPDPEVDGNTVNVKLAGTGIENEAVHEARKACEAQDPGGSMHISDVG